MACIRLRWNSPVCCQKIHNHKLRVLLLVTLSEDIFNLFVVRAGRPVRLQPRAHGAFPKSDQHQQKRLWELKKMIIKAECFKGSFIKFKCLKKFILILRKLLNYTNLSIISNFIISWALTKDFVLVLPHPLPALLVAPFFARSLTLVPRSLLLNRTETLATQASFPVPLPISPVSELPWVRGWAKVVQKCLFP